MLTLIQVSLAANVALTVALAMTALRHRALRKYLRCKVAERQKRSRRSWPTVPSTGRPSTQAEIDGWPHEGTPVHFTASDAKE